MEDPTACIVSALMRRSYRNISHWFSGDVEAGRTYLKFRAQVFCYP